MAVFTISPSLMRNQEEGDLYYIRELLYLFIAGNHKVAKDNDGYVIDIYNGIQRNREFIHMWLQMMSYRPSRFETVQVRLDTIPDEEEMFIKLCSLTNGQHELIVDSLQSVSRNLSSDNSLTYNGQRVHFLDQNEAILTLRPSKNIIQGSIFANGDVSNSNNNNQNEQL